MYKRIRDLREDRDLTQKNMGEILNCSQRIYSNYECGDVDIPTQILIKLAEFHNTSVDYLLDLTDDKRPYSRKRNLLSMRTLTASWRDFSPPSHHFSGSASERMTSSIRPTPTSARNSMTLVMNIPT